MEITRTELIWDGKYDRNGRRVAALRISLPFQTVETVNETAQDRQRFRDNVEAWMQSLAANRSIETVGGGADVLLVRPE